MYKAILWRLPGGLAAGALAIFLIISGCEQQDTLLDVADSGDKPVPVMTFDQEPTKNDPILGKSSGDSGPIPGQYIIVFKDGFGDTKGRAQQIVQQHAGRLLHSYGRVIKGFSAQLPERAVALIERLPFVEYVEQDVEFFAVGSQQNATWGLDRVDQRDLPLNSVYNYDYDGTGVTVYVIDTGIRFSHNEFEGRASFGYDAFGGNGQDCHGHGTHVAGTIGGKTYGIAKNVNLVAVRVLNCSGSGTTSGVIAGIDWVSNNAQGAAVANMSLGGGASTALDNAVRNSIEQGVTYAVAAGNDNNDAANYSPARVTEALTVGATTSSDGRASFSNYGSVVDVFAPGANITSAWSTSNSATNTISGTSMATPHVAGVAALYLDEHGETAPAAVASAIINSASTGRISNPGSGSPNRLLYSAVEGGGGGEPPPPPPPPDTPCSSCEVYSGSLSGPGDYDNHPNGTYYYSGSGTHDGYLRGPTSGADFDLYLYKYYWFWGWLQVAYSISDDSNEDISYNGSSGYYLWRVYSFSGSGQYTFYLDRP